MDETRKDAYPLISLRSARGLLANSIWRHRKEIRRDRDGFDAWRREGFGNRPGIPYYLHQYDAWVVGYIQGGASKIADVRTHLQVNRILKTESEANSDKPFQFELLEGINTIDSGRLKETT